MFLVLSTSLHPNSRSRILARACCTRLQAFGRRPLLFDLAQSPLPPCDGSAAYGDSTAQQLAQWIEQADAVMLASPIYNYDVNAAAKNAVELTGQAWTGKVVAMMLAAGGPGSYMSAMGLANSLMLDFRCLIVPRFIYATGESFDEDALADEEIHQRVDQLVRDTIGLADAVKPIRD